MYTLQSIFTNTCYNIPRMKEKYLQLSIHFIEVCIEDLLMGKEETPLDKTILFRDLVKSTICFCYLHLLLRLLKKVKRQYIKFFLKLIMSQ